MLDSPETVKHLECHTLFAPFKPVNQCRCIGSRLGARVCSRNAKGTGRLGHNLWSVQFTLVQNILDTS
jgi:hypothetical protein